MRWRKFSNFIIVVILSLAYVITTLLNVIGPWHMNAEGGMNSSGILYYYAVLYLFVSLAITWSAYFSLRHKPETLFFLSLILGIIFLIFGAFLWHWGGG